MSEFISVIIPTYNRGYIIEKSINSVLEQTYKNLEVIIVDDCSSDNTEDVVKKITNKRIRYIKLEKNSGANYARNIGIGQAKYDLIAFQDSDDIWHKNKLEKQVEYLKKNKLDMVASRYNQYIENEFKKIIPSKKIDEKNLKEIILFGNVVSTQTMLGKKECFSLKFDEKMPRLQDWEFTIRLLDKYKVGFMNEELVDVYIQENSISKDEMKHYLALKLIREKHILKYKNNREANIENLLNLYKKSVRIGNKKNYYLKKAFLEKRGIRTMCFLILDFFNLFPLIMKLKDKFNKGINM